MLTTNEGSSGERPLRATGRVRVKVILRVGFRFRVRARVREGDSTVLNPAQVPTMKLPRALALLHHHR